MAQRIPYLEQAMVGRSRWWDFLFGAWFLFAGWVLFQGLFAMPIGEIAVELGIDTQGPDPDALEDAMTPAVAFGVLLLLVSVLLVPVAYIVSRLAEGTVGKVFGVIGVAGIVMSILGIMTVAPAMAGAMGEDDTMMLVLGQSPLAYGLLLFSFIGAFVAGWLVQRFIHYRTFQSLITAAARIRWGRIIWTLLLTWGVYAVVTFISVNVLGQEVNPNPERSRMLPFVIATLLFIPIQCAAEELIFRGYLNQALGRFIPSALIVFTLTSVMFGAMHLANPEIGAAKEAGTFWIVAASYVVFGFILSVMVWIDNGLESAIGVHIANNAWAATFINYENSVLPIPGLFIANEPGSGETWLSLLGLAAVLGVIWLTRKPLPGRAKVLAEPEPVPA